MVRRWCKAVLASLALGILAGCGETAPAELIPFLSAKEAAAASSGTAAAPAFKDRSTQALVKTQLSQGAVVVKGPDGYCIDKKALRRASAFLVACAAFSDKAPSVPSEIGALRVVVGPPAPDSPMDIAVLQSFLTSEAGLTTLSRTRDPKSVAIPATQTDETAAYFRVLDASPSAFGKLNSTEWRAIMRLNGHLSLVAVSGYGKIQVTDADGLRLLKRFVATLAAENAGIVSEKETKSPLNALLKRVRG
ncbi:hypothetical protein [Algirhabdus cladophorae]|uniref:hypothetical protein n=1 Tax=Algirhabdus cladophorae TaxID=3377108 RepID=UPI003B8490E9